MEEVWKPIPYYEGFYEASTFGRIRSVDHVFIRKNGVKRSHKGRIITPQHYPNGYQFANLTKGSIRKQVLVHRIILITFIGNKPGYEVNHIDENKDNNRLDNLEWVTHRYNCNYGTRNIRCKEHSDFHGEKNPMYGRKGSLNPQSKNCYAIKDGKIKEFSCIREMANFLGYGANHTGRCARLNIELNGYKLFLKSNFA